jgi:alkylation response protein AidB-like acyl-CoA dehydrogenase
MRSGRACAIWHPGSPQFEESGGLGLGVLDAALIGEKFGKHASAPSYGAAAIAACGSAQQKTSLLPEIAEGALRMGVGISERTAGRRADAGVRCHEGRLDGRAIRSPIVSAPVLDRRRQ